MKMIIERLPQRDCTPGILTFGDFRCFTLELPDLNNQQNISCIPYGLYKCRIVFSGSFGNCVEIRNVVDRTLVRIHYGNFTRDILGCVIVGDALKDIDGDGVIDVSNSKATFKKLMGILPDSFMLSIR